MRKERLGVDFPQRLAGGSFALFPCIDYPMPPSSRKSPCIPFMSPAYDRIFHVPIVNKLRNVHIVHRVIHISNPETVGEKGTCPQNPRPCRQCMNFPYTDPPRPLFCSNVINIKIHFLSPRLVTSAIVSVTIQLPLHKGAEDYKDSYIRFCF